MQQIKLSYIIPIYNAERYLAECLDSIYMTSVEESAFEVICVNDCSPDSSREVVLEYQKVHKNLVLIDHTENKKAGGARNTGLLAAKGEYVWFVDADDMIASNALEAILQICKKYELDALCFNYQLLCTDKILSQLVFNYTLNVQNGVDLLLNHFGNGIIYHLGYAVRTIYKREILLTNHIFFPEFLKYGEDTTYMAEAVMRSSRVMAISDVLYSYRIGITTSSSAPLGYLKGERIYESIFRAGELVIKLKENAEILSPRLAEMIENGLPWFLNRLFIRLIKTDRKERKEFYDLLILNPQLQFNVLKYMDYKNSFIIKNSKLGLLLLNILSYMYKIKHKTKCWKFIKNGTK